MQEHKAESDSVEDADIHICIFPHLDEFMVLDVRDPQRPEVRVVAAGELLTPGYYREVEREFSRMLRSEEAPFFNLMVLPQRLEVFLRWKGMEGLTEMFRAGDPTAEGRRISVFLCGGPVLAMSDEELSGALNGFFEGKEGKLPALLIEEYGSTFRRLLEMERGHVRKGELNELRRAIEGRSSQFYTLWQNRPGPGFSPQ